MASKIPTDKNCKEAIIAIANELINRADDISNDLSRVSSITIHAELNPCEVVNFDVIKNYTVFMKEEA